MNSSENIDNQIHICQKCKSVIPFGKPYYSIGRTLEFFCVNHESNETEIEIIDDDQIITLCVVCGSYFNLEALETILNHLPIPGQETRN